MADYKITVTDINGVTRVYKSIGAVTVTDVKKTFTGHRVSPGTEETVNSDMTIRESSIIDQSVEPWPSSGG